MNPFLCPEFSRGVGNVRKNARVAVLSEGTKIVGFFPFERHGLGVGMPLGGSLNNCQGIVHDPAAEWEARRVVRACKLSVWQFDNLVPGQLPFEGYAIAPVPTAVIDLSDGFAAYYESFQLRAPRFLKSLNRQIRTLQRDCGEIRFEPDCRGTAELRTLMNWKSSQCRRNGWMDVFDRPWVVELVDFLFGTRGDLFSSVLSMLYVGDTPIAGQIGLRCGSFFAGWFTAYDPEFGRYSPGLIQLFRLTEMLAAAGVRTYELGGADSYQNKLKNGDISYAQGMVTGGPLAAGVHRTRTAATSWARHQIRRYPPVYRAADHMLRRSGRIA